MESELREAGTAIDKATAAMAAALAQALQQQAATSDVLSVISGHPTNAQPVFDMIAQRARQVCEGQFCAVFRYDGQLIHLVAHHGMSAEGAAVYQQHFPVKPGRINAIGRAIHDGAVAEIADVEADPDYRSGAVARAVTFRSIVAVPMMLAGRPVGGIAVSRSTVGTFPEKHIAQLRTFADQAVIAVENVRMFNETEDALRRQTATSEVLRVISNSPTDTQPVFEAIIHHAVALCDARYGIVFRLEGGLVHIAAHANLTPDALQVLEGLYPMRPSAEHVSGRVILGGALVEVHDVQDDPLYHPGLVALGGWRSLLAVPMLSRDGRAIGVIWLARAVAGPFPGKLSELLRTASLDPESEAAVNATIQLLARQRTVILVTHRLASASSVDHLVVIDEGQVKTQGSHAELLAQPGLYQRLWQMQSGFVVSGDGHRAEVHGERLQAIPLFRDVAIATLNALAAQFVSEFHRAGDSIYREGDAGDRFFIIVRGTVSVSTRSAGDQSIRLAALQDGDYFGEGEMLNRGRRTTAVTATTPSLVLALSAEHFNAMVNELSLLNKVVTQMALGRSLSTICSVGRRRRSHAVWHSLAQLRPA